MDSFINFKSHNAKLLLFPGLWLIMTFLCISRQTTQGIHLKLCGYIHYGTPQDWLAFSQAPLNSSMEVLASIWLSSFCAFAGKWLIGSSSDLVWPYQYGSPLAWLNFDHALLNPTCNSTPHPQPPPPPTTTWSSLVQVMVCYLINASHYLHQCWFIDI